MVFSVVVREAVWDDVDEAIEWYEEKSKGLGERFIASFEATLSKIIKNPLHYLFITKDVRRCTLKRFPYNIHFVIKENTIVILGVIHRKRSNAYLRRRFRGK
jgi:toxin ParE1/3/4